MKQLIPLFADEPSQSKIELAIHTVRKPGRSHAAKAQLFIAHLRGEFGEPAYWDREIDEYEAFSKQISQ